MSWIVKQVRQHARCDIKNSSSHCHITKFEAHRMLCYDHFLGHNTAETWVHSWPILRGIFGEHSGGGTGLSASTSVILLRTKRFPLDQY
jgi:hypothetical protein